MIDVSADAYRSGTAGEPSPARPAGSVRRTSTVDVTIADESRPELRLEGRAQDLHTTAEGARVLDYATMAGVVEGEGGTLTELTTTPASWSGPLAALVGSSARSGFRRALDAAAPDLAASGGPLALLLDDIPVCLLVSGNLWARRPGVASSGGHPPAGVCAGWQTDGRLLTLAERTGGSPFVQGPVSERLDDPDDPRGWHDMPVLGPWSMRRARRLDLVAEPDGWFRFHAYLRDVRRQDDPAPRTVHEYSVLGRIDETGTVRRIDAVPHVLPAPECPQATASAGRLRGRPVGELRKHVSKTFTGVSTCTHLNDVLRALGDAQHLLDAIHRVRPDRR
ncbi:DUF2889 domain-containing protein [Pseudonocardia oroxyli]|uniref:DUF2889 domain-containing protein n=1 Tax=Pseudonocardia oroxyli TaxID=366584 RepID=A0A1G7TSB5_PSEOR|nr:DUF2889 domain-containing protein [Pseudonocardia oroxyli]SDG38137.1 Protein of unknown function [Pseudonocardia oroxyli]